MSTFWIGAIVALVALYAAGALVVLQGDARDETQRVACAKRGGVIVLGLVERLCVKADAVLSGG
jgi:hypothetical protein